MKNLLKLIQKRQSARTLFDPDKQVPDKDLKKILNAGSWAPTAHNMQNFEIIVVKDKKLLKTIAEINYPTSLTFIRENYRQMSFSKEELKKKKTGVLGTMFPPSWRKPTIKTEDIRNSSHNDFMEKEIISSSALVIVLYDPSRRAPDSEGDFLGIISLGCVMENMWLMANSLGIGFHILSALSSSRVEKDIRKLLSIPAKFKIAYSFRLGFPVKSTRYLRVRREIEDFSYLNRYGNVLRD